jgi:hypothetical protein
MRDYLARHPASSATQYKRVVSAFLDKFALDDKIEMTVDMPGWTDELVAGLTAAYDEDVARIANMDGIDFIEA